MPRETFTQTDKNVGKTMRCLREQAGLSQSDLGKLVNVTYQQIQKYENGKNRISVHCLLEISKVLNVSVAAIINEPRNEDSKRISLYKEELQLLEAFKGIQSSAHKKQLIALAKSLAAK